jgi:hypothetical protein
MAQAVALWAVIVGLLARPTRQQDTSGLPASFFAPIGGGGGDVGAGAGAGGTIPLDTGASTQPIGAGLDIPLDTGVNPFAPQTTAPEETETVAAPAGNVNPFAPAVTAPEVTAPGVTAPGVTAGTIPLDAGGTTQPIGAGLDPFAAATSAPLDPNAGFADPNAFVNPGLADPNAGFTPGVQIPVESDTQNEPEAPPAPPTPPAPPMDWSFLPEDKQIIFGLEMNGPSLVPWTKTKSWNLVNTVRDTVLQSTDPKKDIEAGVTDSYRKQVADDSGPGSKVSYEMDSGVQLRLKVNTNSIRVESEVRSMLDAIQTGQLAKDLSIALGSEVSNITMVTDPEVIPYNSVDDPNASTGGSLPGWIIGAIVGGIIILIPIPAYLLYRRSKRKHIEALAKQQAEAAAARQRMQSRIVKSTGKSFSQGTGDWDVMESGEYYLNTPNGSVSGRQMSGNWLNVDASGRSLTPPRALQQQHQRALYQSNSLGPGGLPQVNRVGSFSGQPGSATRGGSSVYPVHRYSDSASLPSSSSGDR